MHDEVLKNADTKLSITKILMRKLFLLLFALDYLNESLERTQTYINLLNVKHNTYTNLIHYFLFDDLLLKKIKHY